MRPHLLRACSRLTVKSSLTDTHDQTFLRGHTDTVMVLQMSPSVRWQSSPSSPPTRPAHRTAPRHVSQGKLLASGQAGTESDVLVWDAESNELLYRLEEHDGGVVDLAFSDDERLLASVGSASDGKLVIWDLATGAIVTTLAQQPKPTRVVNFGGWTRDVKRRDTGLYQFLTAGPGGVMLWSLNPLDGSTQSTLVRLVPAPGSKLLAQPMHTRRPPPLPGDVRHGP